MTIMSARGGFPHVFRASILHTAVRYHRLPFASKWLKIRVAGNICRMFFSEADATAGTNYIEVPVAAAETPHGEWEGPLEVANIWLLAVTGTSTIEMVVTERRG